MTASGCGGCSGTCSNKSTSSTMRIFPAALKNLAHRLMVAEETDGESEEIEIHGCSRFAVIIRFPVDNSITLLTAKDLSTFSVDGIVDKTFVRDCLKLMQ